MSLVSPNLWTLKSNAFSERSRKLSGVGQKLSPADIASALKSLVAEQNIRKATVWNTPHLNQLGVTDNSQLSWCGTCFPECEQTRNGAMRPWHHRSRLPSPETGTIVLSSSAEKPRAVSLLPRVHLAIVRPEMLRADMHQVFAEAKDSNYLVFITGASRTADIELTTTLGVHGPKNCMFG